METNKIYNCDVLDGLSQLEDNSIDLIITSPPYNKVGLNGFRTHYNKGKKGWIGEVIYGDNMDIDNKPEDIYQQWQIEFLKECFRVLKDDGSMFYNHKNRIVVGKGEILTPYKWLLYSPFKIREEIIWNRRTSPKANGERFIPSTEQIFWLTKSTKPRFKRQPDTKFKGEVWDIGIKRNTKHPAPFPIDIPDNIIPCVAQGERIVVLDPFMGSGTVAVSAVKNGCDYIGFELFQEYIDMAEKRIKDLVI